MLTFQNIMFILISSILCINEVDAQTNNSLIFRYLDKNGNAYLISKTGIQYDPITAMESSSGTYDGGKPAEATIQATQFKFIKDLVKKCLANKVIHLKQRIKPSAFVEEMGKKSAILIYNAPEVLLLEEKLKEFLGKKD